MPEWLDYGYGLDTLLDHLNTDGRWVTQAQQRAMVDIRDQWSKANAPSVLQNLFNDHMEKPSDYRGDCPVRMFVPRKARTGAEGFIYYKYYQPDLMCTGEELLGSRVLQAYANAWEDDKEKGLGRTYNVVKVKKEDRARGLGAFALVKTLDEDAEQVLARRI